MTKTAFLCIIKSVHIWAQKCKLYGGKQMKKSVRFLAGFLAAAVSLVTVQITVFADEIAPQINDNEVVEEVNDEKVIPDADSLTIEECIEYVNNIPEPENESSVGVTGVPISDEETEIIRRVLENDYSKVTENAFYKEAKYNFSSKYYYNQLSSKMKSAYDDMKEACEEFLYSSVELSTEIFAAVTFDEALDSLDDMIKLYRIFYYSNPQYFFLSSGFTYRLDYKGVSLKVYDNCKIYSTKAQIRNGIDAVTEDFMSEFNAVSGTVNKEIAVAKLISNYVTYVSGAQYNQSLMSALYYKKTVCNGYAMSMNYFCNALGIDCITVTSSNHAWNRVLLNGKWFEVDVTWYDTDTTGDYWEIWLNKSTATFLKNDTGGAHVVETEVEMYKNITLPSCVSDDPFVNVSAPTNVKATAGDKQVKVTWTAVSGATKYRVQRLNGSAWSTIATVSTNSYTNTGLTNGTKYSYRVLSSADGSKWSGASVVVSATPAAAVKVSAPTNVKATAGDKQVKVTWTAVSGAAKYRVQRLNGSTWSTVATVSSNSYTNTNLTNGTKYSYRVLASADGSTWSSASAVVSATPAAAVKVSAPTNVKATAGDKQVKLTWTAVSGATKYRIQRLNGSTWSTVATVSTNSYTNTNLTNGTKYSYRVLASADGSTWSSASAVVSATPAAAVKVSAPTNVKATSGDKQVKLTWTAVSGAAKYRIQRLNGSTWSTVATVSTNSYTNTNLTNGTKYSYRVLASADGSTWSSASAVVSATPAAAVKVSAPTNVKATAGDKQVKLTWTAVSGATKYRIQRLNGSTWSTIATVSTNSYTNTGLTNGTKYSYRVLASANGSTWSSASAVVSATPAAAVKVSAPTNVKATAGDKQITVTWNAVSGATQYCVQRLNGSTWNTIGNTKTNSYTNTGLTNGTSYSYRVLSSADGSTWSGVSAVVSATPQ